ncbi:radical SAM protein [Thomasclavelia cocleata]|uniref:radical SAM protein n=1 Tax=Thomasclavelia cocleata TaxID=69824 RepID=UPI002570ECC7|nr:radical SAM protein [Thomasclavelia cocleata]
MYEYLPWSKQVLDKAYIDYQSGNFSIIDAELGGICNLNCIYCDSPDRNKKSLSVDIIKKLLDTKQFEWLFICGLGEPAYGENKVQLIELLKSCRKNNVKCSMFTNLINFDEELFSYIELDVLYIMFKLDSFDENKLKLLYGNPNINYKDILNKIEQIASYVKIKDNCTNICASIVPTTINYKELPEVIKFCMSKNIFPLIGDLEDSGKGQNVYKKLKLSNEQLKIIKKELSNDYKIPICPSVLFGIHILYNGIVAVDKSTGLSCHWFWLTEPKIKYFKNIRDYQNIEELTKEIINYRITKIDYLNKLIPNIDDLIFGGCGGNIKELLKFYLSIHGNFKENNLKK